MCQLHSAPVSSTWRTTPSPSHTARILKGTLEAGDPETISAKTQTLIQASMKLGEAMYKAQQGEGGEGPASDEDAARAAGGAHGGEDVVDAEFEEVDGDDHKKSA